MGADLMARPTNAQLAADLGDLRNRIKVALELHHPVHNPYQGVMCRVCRDPYPCDTALALGAR
jgi:hypothetical protein